MGIRETVNLKTLKQEDDFLTNYYFKKSGKYETQQLCSVNRPILLNK